MRRHCDICGRDYTNDPVTASGYVTAGTLDPAGKPRDGKTHVHIIQCSWACLVSAISDERLIPQEVAAGDTGR